MPGSVESQVAVVADRVAHLETEVERNRVRLHNMESAVHGVRVLSRAVDDLQESLPSLARRAAQEAVAEDRRARHRDLFGNLRTYAAIASVGVALGALIVGLVLR